MVSEINQILPRVTLNGVYDRVLIQPLSCINEFYNEVN